MMTSIYPVILEASLRSLLAAAAVWTGLRLLRVANVLVLKAAWALVLVAAFALPLAPNWLSLPGWAALKLPSFSATSQVAVVPASDPKVENESAASQAMIPAATDSDSGRYSSPAISDSHSASAAVAGAIDDPSPEAAPANDAVMSRTKSYTPITHDPATGIQKSDCFPIRVRIADTCLVLYLSVAAALLLRLLVGLASAIRLWFAAKPVTEVIDASIMEPIRVRSSAHVASPVNIGSGIVLPAEYSQWDDEKLRIVLAHERSHIRQGDFYLQLLSGLYASVFWFSPLGWWLKRKLYELGEAISDRAGLEEAASRASYAQLLLEFAALPRPTLTGVAMARTSHLSQRIERLLNESSFRQAFAASGRRALLAIVLVPLALLGATSLVVVQAAAPSTQNQPAAISGQSTPDQVTDTAPAPSAAPTPAAVPAPATAPAPAAAPNAVPAAPSDDQGALPAPPTPPSHEGPVHVEVSPGPEAPHVYVHVRSAQFAAMPPMPPLPPEAFNFNLHRFAYAFDMEQDGDPYALIGSDGKVLVPQGRFFHEDDDRQTDIEKARKQAHGSFLWFQHDGKSYIVEDPNIVSQIEAMNKPMDDLQGQMRDLSKQMREFGQQQREKTRSMRDSAVQTPDLSKELAELKAAEAALQAKQGATITQQELRELQREIGKIQGELGSLQGKLVMDQSSFAKAMSEFGEQQGKYGAQIGKLGAEMGRIARENHTKMDGIIKDSLSNGKAKQVQ